MSFSIQNDELKVSDVSRILKASNITPPGVIWQTGGVPPSLTDSDNRWYGVAWSGKLGLFAAVSYSGHI